MHHRAQGARGQAAELAIHGNDAAGMNSRVVGVVESFVFRVVQDQLAAVAIGGRFAEHDDPRAFHEDALEVGLVVPNRFDRPGGIGEHRVEDREPALARPDQLRRHHAQVERGLGPLRPQLANLGERPPVFPTKRKNLDEVQDLLDPGARQRLGTPRPDSLDESERDRFAQEPCRSKDSRIASTDDPAPRSAISLMRAFGAERSPEKIAPASRSVTPPPS